MILSFGAILMHTRLTSTALPPDSTYRDAVRIAESYSIGIGGKAAVQALAAANAGAKVALVSKIGDDHYGKNMLLKLRQRGVITSGVGRNNAIPTGTCVDIGGKTRDRLLALGASQWAEADQIPEEILNPGTVLMLQTEITHKQNSLILEKAKECEATTILNLSPQTELSPDDMNRIDYLITPESHKGYVADAGKYKDLTLIVLNKDGTALAFKAGQLTAEIAFPKHESITYKNPSASEDAFCGTLAACLYSKMSLNKSMKIANIARGLTASTAGHAEIMPYSDDVKEIFEAT